MSPRAKVHTPPIPVKKTGTQRKKGATIVKPVEPAAAPPAQEEATVVTQNDLSPLALPAKPDLSPEIVTGIIKRDPTIRTIAGILINGRSAQSQNHVFPMHDQITSKMLAAYNKRDHAEFAHNLSEYLTWIPRFVPHCGTEEQVPHLMTQVHILMDAYGFVPVAINILGNLSITRP